MSGKCWRSIGQCLAILTIAAVAWADESVVNSKHDLSARSPNRIRAVHEDEVCIFCHTPHNAAPQTPLWNRENPQFFYRIYQSSTTDARIDQPSGPSKMCLSCHDGSLALGNVLSRPLEEPIVMTARTMPPGTFDRNSNLTNDLSDDHPIGFRYDRQLSNVDKQIRPPEIVSRQLPLGVHAEVHCTTCHDPHNNELGSFLRESDQMSAICISCHDMTGWDHGAHAISGKHVSGRVVDPRERLKYTNVRDNGCASCHRIHSAPQRERLLRFTQEENNCLNCHSGEVAKYNIASEIGKSRAHDPNFRTGVHDPVEQPFTMFRHVECVDCHNPHASRQRDIGVVQGTLGQVVKGPVEGVAGVSLTGRQLDESRFEYEICFRCHADGTQRPRLITSRQVTQTNTRLEFQISNPSFHPVTGPRRNPDVVSLISPLRVGSIISCTDCHNSDNSRFFGGSGANGPHGSIYEPLLRLNYERNDLTVESQNAYALCYDCHRRESILNNESFALHRTHVVDARTPCSVCHDAHGVYRGQGNASNHSALINFDLSVVSAATGPDGRRLEFVDTGRLSGNCTLVCHNVTHISFPYGQAAPRTTGSSKLGKILGGR
jgi:predicted CXXCH cytochrome family protein